MEQKLSDPSLVADMSNYKKVNKEYRDLEPIVEAYEVYKNLLSNISFNRETLNTEKDPEMRELAKMELDETEAQLEPLEEEIRKLLIPKDPEDDKNAILEIRGGTGGDEASIFAGDLYRMYMKYCVCNGAPKRTKVRGEANESGSPTPAVRWLTRIGFSCCGQQPAFPGHLLRELRVVHSLLKNCVVRFHLAMIR